MVIVIIDGARYSETFGDPGHTYIPAMTALAQEGALVNTFYNDSLTYTSRAIPALWCGTWTGVRDTVVNGYSTQYTTKPSIFEYYRKQADAPEDSCVYVLKYITSLWLPSIRPDYGPDYWPTFVSEGSDDRDVLEHTLTVMETTHPKLLWVYLADVDHAGHSGNWNDYTQAITTADSIVGAIWDAIQSNPYYANRTNLMVTNDHGRHDDQHGGFSGHGDGCDGCRHIMLLTRGPDFQSNLVTNTYRRTPDFATTACYLLGLSPEYTTGDVITEILSPEATDNEIPVPTSLSVGQNYPNPFNGDTQIQISIHHSQPLTYTIYNVYGQVIRTQFFPHPSVGMLTLHWDGTNEGNLSVPSGIYFFKCSQSNDSIVRKMVLLK